MNDYETGPLTEPTSDALKAGVAPGGLLSRSEIRILVLYLVRTVGSPLSRPLIGKVMQDQSIANYFETMDAVSELVENGNLDLTAEDGEEQLTLTERGRTALLAVVDDIPKTAREKAVRTAIRFQTLERNARENKVTIEPGKDGFTVTFTLQDGDAPLMQLAMFAGSREQAETLKNHFLEDPVRIYETVLTALMVD